MTGQRKFAFVIDGEVAFALAPIPDYPQSERIVAALSSNPEIIEVPQDHPHFDEINSDWIYIGGEFKNVVEFNPNVAPPEETA